MGHSFSLRTFRRETGGGDVVPALAIRRIYTHYRPRIGLTVGRHQPSRPSTRARPGKRSNGLAAQVTLEVIRRFVWDGLQVYVPSAVVDGEAYMREWIAAHPARASETKGRRVTPAASTRTATSRSPGLSTRC